MSDVAPSGAPGLHPALVRNSGYLLSRLGFLAVRHFSEHLEAVGLTPRLWGALNVLEAEGAVSQQQLGKAIGMDPSSMVGSIDELESKGFVERRPHPSDRRAHALHITADGHAALTRGREVAAQAREELLGPLDEAERAQFHDFLLRLTTAAAERSGRPISPPGSPAGLT